MTAAALISLFLAALTVCAHARRLHQGTITFDPPIIGGPGPAPSPSTGPWANFTRTTQTLYVAVKVINSTVAASDEECASACDSDLQCEAWTWCPANVTAGCGIPAANASYSSTVPPGGCILSHDDSRNRSSLYVAYGPAVPFMAGVFHPQAASGASAGRRLLQAGSVWSSFTYGQNRFYQGIDALPTVSAQTAEQCAAACNADKNCEFWSLCPPAVGAAGCEVASFAPNASPQIVPAGTCVLSYDGTADQQAFFLMWGSQVAFEAGRWNSSASAGTSPSPGTGPIVPLPTLPGSLPGGSSNTTLPSAATISIRSQWAGGVDEGTCWKWNGTGFEEDPSSTFTSTGTAKLDSSTFDAYLAGLCASEDAAGGTIAADLLKGGKTARMAVLASTQSCPGASSKTNLLTPLLAWIRRQNTNNDIEFIAKYARAWVEAGDEMGFCLCVTLVAFDTATGKAIVQTIKP